MSIDIGALRKFQDLWGPVLETIPAVIEATAKQDDLARAIAAQNKLPLAENHFVQGWAVCLAQ